MPGLGEIAKRPPRLLPEFRFEDVPPLFEMAKDAFGVERMMWGSDFPPVAGREGYGNALRGVMEHPAFAGDQVSWSGSWEGVRLGFGAGTSSPRLGPWVRLLQRWDGSVAGAREQTARRRIVVLTAPGVGVEPFFVQGWLRSRPGLVATPKPGLER